MSGSHASGTIASTSSPKGPTSKALCDALAVNRNTYPWTVLVQVLERHPPKESRDTGKRKVTHYRHYVVTDMKGTKVGIAIYGTNITFFDDTLLPYRRYYISNADVAHCEEQYQLGPYMYSWTLYRTTPVDPYEEDTIPRFPCTYNSTKFTDFYSHADRDEHITVTAFVVQAFPEIRHHKQLRSRDYILISDEMLPIIFRVWNNPLEQYNIELWQTMPQAMLIVARNVKVTTYHGLSLATKYNTYILEDPPLADEETWTSWYEKNHPEITDIVGRRVYHDIAKMFRPPVPSEIIAIETARTTMENIKTTWIKGRVSMNPGQGSLWSTCCKFCSRTYKAGDNTNVYCATCKEWAPIQLRSHIGIRITDETGTMDIILSTPELERIIPFTPTDIKTAEDNGYPLHDEIEEIIEDKEVHCFIKYFDTEVHGNPVRRHPVLRLYTEDDMIHHTLPIQPQAPTDETADIHVPPAPQTTKSPTTDSPPEGTSSATPAIIESTATNILSSSNSKKGKRTAQNTCGTRRSLSFNLGNIEKEKAEHDHARKAASSEPPHTNHPDDESPVKKLKDKVKEP